MHELFFYTKFNGDISKWNTSNVIDMSYMSYMFYKSKFNGSIIEWNVSKLENVSCMFYRSEFGGDLSKWDISKVVDMDYISSKYRNLRHFDEIKMSFNPEIILPHNYLRPKLN